MKCIKMKCLLLITAALCSFSGLRAQSLAEAQKLMDYQKYEAAKRMFNELIAKEPGNADYVFYLGEVYYRLSEEDSAISYYARAYNANPGSLLGNVSKARILIFEQKQDEAKQYIDKAMALAGPKNGDMIAEIAKSYILFAKPEKKNPKAAIDLITPVLDKNKRSSDLLLTLGDAYLAQNEGSPAITNYRKALELEPNNPKMNLRVGQLYARVGNAAEADNYFQTAYNLDSMFPPVYAELAEAAYNKRQFTVGKRYYEKYLALVENDVNARKRYVGFLFLTRDYEKTVSEADEVIKVDQAPIMYRLKGYSFTELKNFPDAKTAMDKYFSIQDPKKYITFDYDYYGRILSALGMDSLAAVSYLKEIEMDTSKFETYLDVAGSYRKAKKYELAGKYYDIYLQRKPNTNVYYQVGQMYYAAKDFNKALANFDKVKELNPELFQGYLWAGYSKSQLDPTAEKALAKADFEKVIELINADTANYDKNKSNLVNAYAYLGSYYQLVKKDNATAKIYWNKVLEINPNNKQAKSAIEVINQPAQKPKGK